MLCVAYFPYEENQEITERLREKVSEHEHFWVRQDSFAFIYSDIDSWSLFDSIKPFLGPFDRLVVCTVLRHVAFGGTESEALWNWLEQFA